MTSYLQKHIHFLSNLTIMAFILTTGCAIFPQSQSESFNFSDIEGNWIWSQDNFWNGNLVFENDAEVCTGTLNDLLEGTYGDRITDVEISGNQIKFTRDGRYGIQYWEGTLKVEDGILKITDGHYQKQVRNRSGTFWAEKREAEEIITDSVRSSSFDSTDIEGEWTWSQLGPYYGNFVLERNRDTYTGTLDDVYEKTYGDKITDVEISGDQIKFTRDGLHGIQYWEGVLKVEDGRLKITNGRWRRGEGTWNSFLAERRGIVRERFNEPVILFGNNGFTFVADIEECLFEFCYYLTSSVSEVARKFAGQFDSSPESEEN